MKVSVLGKGRTNVLGRGEYFFRHAGATLHKFACVVGVTDRDGYKCGSGWVWLGCGCEAERSGSWAWEAVAASEGVTLRGIEDDGWKGTFGAGLR